MGRFFIIGIYYYTPATGTVHAVFVSTGRVFG